MAAVRLPRRRRCPMLPACLPVPRSLRFKALLLGDDGLTILAAAAGETARCPLCAHCADHVHSRYVRTLANLPWADVTARLRVHTRKFFCDNPACPRRIFAERLAGVAAAFVRRTDRQHMVLTAIAL